LNFFEYQDQARRQSRWLVFLFILAVIFIIVVIDLAMLVVFGVTNDDQQQALFSVQALQENVPQLVGGALVTVGVIALASLFKSMMLRSGGGKVARELGGTLVNSDTSDSLRRRLYNVVEEIALAAGIPVPEIYVLEQESGINAFAAGFSPSDAAVTVTRGALEKLDRNELQGVIAHEFSHIFNGDMRLNIRLMGALFGILMLSLIGRRVLHGSYFMGRSKNSNGGAIMLAAVAVMVVGYIGLFFGRWIKSAVARQREYLADASAVQFTRDPSGISGALQKIAVYSEASYLDIESEEVSHMLFGDGQQTSLFATHPPLNERILRIDPAFQPADLARLAKRLQREQQSRAEKRSAASARQPQKTAGHRGGLFDAGQIVDSIGSPDFSRILMAASLAATIPEDINRAAHSGEWATEVLFYCLLDADPEVREQQLLAVAQRMGAASEARVRELLKAAPDLATEQQLPLFSIAFPEFKRRPPDYIHQVQATVKVLIEADGRTDVFEYLLANLIALHLRESASPHRVRMAGNKRLQKLSSAALDVIAILAMHGQSEPAAIAQAYTAGVVALGAGSNVPLLQIKDWCAALDRALPLLDSLKPADKQTLLKALLATVMADNRIAVAEMELLRVVCAMLHIPLPMLSSGAETSA